MSLVTLNIPQEIKDRLQLEENQSKLVSDLLREHFSINKISLHEKLKELDNKKQIEIETIEKQKEEIVGKIEKKEEEEVEQHIEQEKQDNKRKTMIHNCIINAKEVYNKDITEQQAIEYIDSDNNSLKDYIDKL